MEWTSPCRTLLCCATWIFKRSISSCFSTSQTKTGLPARSFSSDFLRSSERTLYITFAPSSSNTFAICQATLFLFATPVTRKFLFSRSRKLIFCSPYKAVTLSRGDLCINRHCEQSEAIQKNSGSPRRFAAHDDDLVRFDLLC